jgi:oxygen-independent coproporphyrinogen-3 oxidase
MSRRGLYIHIPFCPQVCPYCAFATVKGGREFHDRYVAAVCKEIEGGQQRLEPGPFDTVFFGGGTPSELAPAYLQAILQAAAQWWGLKPDAEITIEVNPGTADFNKFSDFKKLGFNRLSVGAQSFVDKSLKALGRIHSAVEAQKAFEVARTAGFDNLSLDLISSIPDMPQAHWRHSLNRAVELGPEHISSYALTIEEGTVFAERQRQGRLQPLPEEEDARSYEWTMERLEKAGYAHYEVSNFARPGRRSRHNWGYWTGAEYLGVGLSAHSFGGDCRSWNMRDLAAYLRSVEAGDSPQVGFEYIDANTARRERVWMGLRTNEGVELGFEEQLTLQRQERFAALLEAGYILLDGARLRLQKTGFLLADALGVEVVSLLEGASVYGGVTSCLPERNVK